MLNRKVVKEFLSQRLRDSAIKLPSNISTEDLVEAFCHYVEDDYYDWLKDNFNTFFQQDSQNKIKHPRSKLRGIKSLAQILRHSEMLLFGI
ncbi:MAG: hypothetical protein HYR76_05950 [Ignavibacteria bacterium]|nr:hypothetical protein [Ignavibacteria bacterium]MBI3765036.1 hypothetical protein [Ignavibacteriales bacterium]